MGKERLVDKTNKPVHPLSVPTTLSPLHVTNRASSDLGVLPIGVFKGQAAFWDLDKAVNLPLAWIEQQHILGILDGREEDYDLQTLVVPQGSGVDWTRRERLTVPTGEVFYLNAVRLTAPDGGTGNINCNWRCSIWPSREDPADEDGQRFLNTAIENDVSLVEFGPIATAWAVENQVPLLRLPAGSKLTLTAVISVAATDSGEQNATLELFGFRTRALVA